MFFPFFSIIIPVFRAKDYITRCLESCINQTFQDYEVIVIDDCGQDKTIEIAKNFAKQDRRITIIRNSKNLGAFHARTKGIQFAKGKYCVFLDCDDFLDWNTLQILYCAIQQDNPDILHYRFAYYPRNLLKKSPYLGTTIQTNRAYQMLNIGPIFQSMCDKAIKTEYAKLVANKLFFIHPPFSCMEDGLFSLVASFETKSYKSINKILYFYQNNPNSTTKSTSQESLKKKIIDFKNGLRIIQKVKKLYPDHIMLISQYEKKVISAYILETRKCTKSYFLNVLKLLGMQDYIKILPIYLKSSLLSLFFFYRWQTLIRILIYTCTLGRIKL